MAAHNYDDNEDHNDDRYDNDSIVMDSDSDDDDSDDNACGRRVAPSHALSM